METELATEGRMYDKARLRIIGVGPKEFVLPSYILVEIHRTPDFSVAVGYTEGLEQLFAGWMETISQFAQESSEGWPTPHTVHVRFPLTIQFFDLDLIMFSWIGTSEDL
jgi:hypothetical protein